MIAEFWTELTDLSVIVPLLGSLIAGTLIGLERESQGKPAGLRTHAIVCFAAALMTLLSLRMQEWSIDLQPGTQIVSDMSRMPHAILTGIGFLGAGVIFRQGPSVKGLTTAASLWLTAALGIVFGTGLMGLASLGTVIAIAVLFLMRFLQRFVRVTHKAELVLGVALDCPCSLQTVGAWLKDLGFQARVVSFDQDQERGLKHYRLLVACTKGPIDVERLSQEMQTRLSPKTLRINVMGLVTPGG